MTELETAAHYFKTEEDDPNFIVQEIGDNIGTHAILTEDNFHTLMLIHVTSWRLYNDGRIHAMLADERK